MHFYERISEALDSLFLDAERQGRHTVNCRKGLLQIRLSFFLSAKKNPSEVNLNSAVCFPLSQFSSLPRGYVAAVVFLLTSKAEE